MKIISTILFILATLLTSNSMAEVAVIVHSSNADSIDAKFIKRLYLGKKKSFPSGATAIPVSLKSGEAARDEFNKKLLSKSSSQLKAYWSKLVFTGKATPPKEMSATEVIKIVQDNPNVIGYVDSGHVIDGVKVVGKF